MRKLLVASQKGGVGKTTTSVNLAAAAALAGARVLLVDTDPLSNVSSALGLADHPNRRSLADHGLALAGSLVCNVVPGLDVLSPYEGSGCSDEDLSYLLTLLATPAVAECYTCLIVDTPPFLGANPNQLLQTCDQFLIVMRAEALAHRTLPALLELAQRSRTENHSIQLRGILLTLSECDEAPRWERELRGRLGTRVLPQVIPFDDAVTQAALESRPLVANNRGPAALAYISLVESLGLASGARDTAERTSAAAALMHAAASLERNALTREPAPQTSAPSRQSRPVPTVAPPPAPPVNQYPAYTESDFTMLSEPGEPTVQPNQRPPSGTIPVAGPPPADSAAGFPPLPTIAWVAGAVLVGVCLRFVPLDESMIPVFVGVGVAGLMVILLTLFSQPAQSENVAQAGPSSPATPPPTSTPDPRPAASRRLSGLKRRLGPRRTV